MSSQQLENFCKGVIRKLTRHDEAVNNLVGIVAPHVLRRITLCPSVLVTSWATKCYCYSHSIYDGQSSELALKAVVLLHVTMMPIDPHWQYVLANVWVAIEVFSCCFYIDRKT